MAEWLVDAPGVHNVVVHVGAARDPGGDAVQFDVRKSAANPVFTALRGFGLDHDVPIAVEQVDAALTAPALARADHGALRRERAPVWEMVEAVIHSGETYAPSFYILLAIAGVIGAIGILTNSQILIVEAMVVGPEYNGIIAVALAFAAAVRASGRTPAAFLAGLRPVTNLIDTPNLLSVVVATMAGIVGVVSLTEARANALIGVFISVTTIPAAADVGVSIAYRSWHEAAGSTLQLLLNVVLLILVGAVRLVVQRRIWTRQTP